MGLRTDKKPTQGHSGLQSLFLTMDYASGYEKCILLRVDPQTSV